MRDHVPENWSAREFCTDRGAVSMPQTLPHSCQFGFSALGSDLEIVLQKHVYIFEHHERVLKPLQ